MFTCDETTLAVAADLIVADFLGARPGDEVLITADTATDPRAVRALVHAARLQDARVAVLTVPQLPFQGGLADPYVPEPLVAAVQRCDIWLDLTFPYLAGSHAHDESMRTKRVRSLMLHDMGTGGIARLFGSVDFDRLFALQNAIDALISDAVGRPCRITSPAGTDLSFVMGKPATVKHRRVRQPGTYTPPGSAAMYPDIASVRGTVVIDAVFHEYFTHLQPPIVAQVEGGRVREISGGGSELRVMDRALRRAGNGQYGSIIHVTHGFHPAARLGGGSFLEAIRAPGNDAVGFGIPWWDEGGGENHPDGVMTMQSLWIDGRQIVRDGAFATPELARLEQELVAAPAAAREAVAA